MLGDDALLGNNATFGNNALLGNNATLGKDGLLGDGQRCHLRWHRCRALQQHAQQRHLTTAADNADGDDALGDNTTHGGIAAKRCNDTLRDDV